MKAEDAEEYTQALGQVVAGGWRQIALGKRLGVPKSLGLSVEEWVQQRLGGYVRLSVPDRQEAVKTLAAEGESQRGIAKMLGVDPMTVNRDLRGVENATPAQQKDLENDVQQDAAVENATAPLDALATLAADEELRKAAAAPELHKKRTEREAKNKAELEAEAAGVDGVYLGDFRELAPQHIPNDSAQLVLTDPPYDKKGISLVSEIAKEAKRVLRPGGTLLFYSGQKYLIDVVAAASVYLRFWWIFCLTHRDQHQLLNKLGVRCAWKPILWFVKGTRGDVQSVVSDLIEGGGREKSEHEWQQAESEARHLIETFTAPKGTVVDFCAGSGTVLSAAKKIGRKAIGFEKDPVAFKSMALRLKR